MNRRIRLILPSLIVLVALVGVPVWLTWRAVRQERLNDALIFAVTDIDPRSAPVSVVALTAQGANPNTVDYWDAAPDTRSYWQRLFDQLAGRRHRRAKGVSVLIRALSRYGLPHPFPTRAVVSALLEAGADPNIADENGWTPLMLALRQDELCARLLLDKGANPNAQTNDGTTALLLASSRSDSVDLLLAHGVDVRSRNAPGIVKTLQTMAEENWVDSLQMVLAHGADVNAQNADGQTVLMYAAHSPEAAKVLLAYGADVHIRDKWGHTALEYARKFSLRPVISLLKQAGAKD